MITNLGTYVFFQRGIFTTYLLSESGYLCNLSNMRDGIFTVYFSNFYICSEKQSNELLNDKFE